MNILQISTADRAGGAERIATILMEEFRREGHDARMAVGEKRGSSPWVYEIPNRRLRSWPARLAYTLPPWMRKRKWRGSHALQRILLPLCEPGRANRLGSGLEDFDHPATDLIPSLAGFVPDLLHAHNLHGGYFDLRKLPELSHIAPFTITLHDAWLFSGHCAHSFDCEKWVSGCGQCPYPMTPPAVRADRTAENWNLKRDIFAASRLYAVCVSEFLRSKLQRSMWQPRMSRVIYNGIDPSLFHPAPDRATLRQKWGFPKSAHIVLFSAAGVTKNPWKDYGMLQAAMAELALSHCGPQKLILLCMGESGPRQEHGSWESRFTGYLTDPRLVSECFQIADLYLHPARADSFPNVILEAMACGVPSVATDVGGIPEQIRDGENGFLCRLGDVRSMAERARATLEDPGLRNRLVAGGLERIARDFTLKAQLQAYSEWYATIREDFRAWRAGLRE